MMTYHILCHRAPAARVSSARKTVFWQLAHLFDVIYYVWKGKEVGCEVVQEVVVEAVVDIVAVVAVVMGVEVEVKGVAEV